LLCFALKRFDVDEIEQFGKFGNVFQAELKQLKFDHRVLKSRSSQELERVRILPLRNTCEALSSVTIDVCMYSPASHDCRRM